MKLGILLTAAASLYHTAVGAALAEKPPYFILTGDSTVAVGGGWGDGFLATLKAPAAGINPAKGGATTASFRAEGRWASAIQAVKDNAGAFRPIVTIQFGHNDQKETSGLTTAQFQANLETMGKEVIAAGGTPIIITSLTRRTFENGKVIENLAEHSQLAINAANNIGAKFLQLNRASTDYVNAIGSTNAQFYNLAPSDRTHLNAAGETVFGRMVVDLLLAQRSDLTAYFNPNAALSAKLKNGEFATGAE